MSNIIKQKFKHGIFSYYSNDQYIGKSLSEYGEWSEAEVILLKQLLADNENLIEVGSNIGTHTIPLAKKSFKWRHRVRYRTAISKSQTTFR